MSELSTDMVALAVLFLTFCCGLMAPRYIFSISVIIVMSVSSFMLWDYHNTGQLLLAFLAVFLFGFLLRVQQDCCWYSLAKIPAPRK